jgi:predicted DNA-binding transcriptional regulator YafY
MNDHNAKRLSRLTALVTQLQTKRLVTSTQLAEKFGVSVRTIYRDIKTLEQAGIPILTEEGKGYTLMDGYRLPPVMFTESEANALVTVGRLLLKGNDTSLSEEYLAAISKVKAVLQQQAKEKVNLLSNRIAISPAIASANPSSSLTLIQNALTSFKILNISYHSEHRNEETERMVEPFALYYSLQESWLLIAYCRLRQDFRMFRLDRILKIKVLDLSFTPHKLSLAEYLAEKEKKFTTPDIPLS